MIDADHFKKVNDEHGHAVGDQALNHLTRIIQDNLRQTDLLARYGGEELVVLMPGTLLAHAHLVAERVRALVECTVLTLDDEKHLPITVSIGLAEWLPSGCRVNHWNCFWNEPINRCIELNNKAETGWFLQLKC